MVGLGVACAVGYLVVPKRRRSVTKVAAKAAEEAVAKVQDQVKRPLVSVPGIEPHLLNPFKTWRDKAEFDTTARQLVRMFQDNFVKYESHVDPDVRADLLAFFRKVVPEGRHYRHQNEGPDDMPAHIKSALTQTQLCIPVEHGQLVLGTWQGIYLCEHRDRGGGRSVVTTLLGGG